MSDSVSDAGRQAIREALGREMSERRRELRARLDGALAAALEEALGALDRPLDLPQEIWATASPGNEALQGLREETDRLAAASDQVAILNALVEGSGRFAARAALFVPRKDRVVGWTATGFPTPATGEVRRLSLSLSAESALGRAASSAAPVRGDDRAGGAEVWEAFGVAPSDAFEVHPLRVRGRVAALLFADSGTAEAGRLEGSALAVLARLAEACLERTTVARAPNRVAAGTERRPSESWEASRPPATPAPPPPPGPPPSASDPHDEARRFARLLVNEILLYRGQDVVEGRQRGDLASRLREDLERSEQAYRQRVPPEVQAGTDHFREEAIRTLANGDPALLGW